MLIDGTFNAPRAPVSVVAIGEAGEALLVRAILESIGAAVLLHLIGTPEDFLRVLDQGEGAPGHLIICAHGDETGIVFGDYDGEIDATSLVEGSMPAAVIAERVNLPGKVVVSTACRSGLSAFGRAFVQGGVSAYIGPRGFPEGADAALFVHLLFDRLLRKEETPEAALHHIQRSDERFADFRIFGRQF